MVEPSTARRTWRTLEPRHGLVYFAPEGDEARWPDLQPAAGER